MILLIDNYDSFVHNLARYFQRLGQETLVARNDRLDVSAVRSLDPAAIVLSPGPGAPDSAGCCLEVVRDLHRQIPMLGVCLGHQAIAQALGGAIVRAPEPMHGRVSQIEHDGRGVFFQLPNPLTVCRYHSLAVAADSLPADLEVSATTADGLVMAFRHRGLPVVGVQFHPESILTEAGYPLLANFLRLAGLPSTPAPLLTSEHPLAPPKVRPQPAGPVTF